MREFSVLLLDKAAYCIIRAGRVAQARLEGEPGQLAGGEPLNLNSMVQNIMPALRSVLTLKPVEKVESTGDGFGALARLQKGGDGNHVAWGETLSLQVHSDIPVLHICHGRFQLDKDGNDGKDPDDVGVINLSRGRRASTSFDHGNDPDDVGVINLSRGRPDSTSFDHGNDRMRRHRPHAATFQRAIYRDETIPLVNDAEDVR